MAMKASCIISILLVGAALAASTNNDAITKVKLHGEDRTITKVVKLLQRMLDKSEEDAAADKVLYAKYKCFTDSGVAAKTTSIKELTVEIATLENRIAELQATNGELAFQTSTLDKDIAANRASDVSAGTVRSASHLSFTGMETDLITAIGQMQESLTVLKSLSLGQTGSAFLAGSSNAQTKDGLSPKAREALTAVSALLPPNERRLYDSFLQGAPETKTKGGAIVGILQNLKTTFEFNLQSARDSEAAELKAFQGTTKVLESSRNTMQKSLSGKQTDMGTNDGELSSKKTSFDTATGQKSDDERDLATLKEQALTKASNFEERKMLRANEDAALSQAISILNSDAAFSSFASTDATSTGKLAAASFFQIRSFFLVGGKYVSSHLRNTQVRSEAAEVLEQSHSTRLAQLGASLLDGNPFDKVITEIDNMKATIAAEATADTEKKTWCETERRNSGRDLAAKKGQIMSLNAALNALDVTIGSGEEPMTGLKQQIGATQTSLLQNQDTQRTETKLRKEENARFQADSQNLVEAEDTLDRAVKVLQKYYEALETKIAGSSSSFLQVDLSDPDQAGMASLGAHSTAGTSAIETIEFILSEAQKERQTAIREEGESKTAFDQKMAGDKSTESDLQTALVNLQGDLATNEGNQQQTSADLKDTTQAKKALKNYLLQIKPGCDFIADNFATRQAKRGTESQSLEKAVELIHDAPVYKSAVAAAAATTK